MRLPGCSPAGLVAMGACGWATAVLTTGPGVPAVVDVLAQRAEVNEAPLTIYDPDPQHLWNRLHDALFVRIGRNGEEYGRDRFEPLLWRGTRHLLGGDPHRRLLAVLDEFSRGGQSLVHDPLKRAMLQRDLWLVFSWLESSHDEFHGFGETPADWRRRQHALRDPLARALAAVALTPGQIAALPDTYAAAARSREFADRFDPDRPERPYLPPDLLEPGGPWVAVGRGNDLVAGAHVLNDNPFTNSAFTVFIKLPDGRAATRAYVERLAAFDGPRLVPTPSSPVPTFPHYNPAIPQFPPGTEVALVRQAMLVASTHQLTATRLAESVQIRVYRKVPPWTPDLLGKATLVTDEVRSWQSPSEFFLSRVRLFAGRSGGLRPAAQHDRDFLTGFSTHGNDPFETVHGETAAESSMRTVESLRAAAEAERHRASPVERCVHCHNLPGVYSFNTYVQNAGRLSPATVDDVVAAGMRWKRNAPDWALLRRLMTAARAR